MKKLLAVLTAIVAGVSALFAQTVVTTDAEIRSAVKVNNANIQLGADIDLSNSTLSIPSNQTVTMDLNGHKLDRKLTQRGEGGGQVITVRSGATLNLSNGTLTGAWGRGGGGLVNENGTANLTNVIITNNVGEDRGGGIYNYGTLTMTGGEITNNISQDKTAPEGGGGLFNAQNCTATLTNVTISGNKAEVKGGGGICNYGTMTLDGCTVTGNNCQLNGGGIWTAASATLNMQGTNTVTGNKAASRSDGVYNNLFLKTNALITVTGSLAGSTIGIDMEKAGTFTDGLATYDSGVDPSTIFTSDSKALRITSYNGEGHFAVDYIERAWDNEQKRVVETTKTLTHAVDYNAVPEEGDYKVVTAVNGWFQLGGFRNDSLPEYYVVCGNVNHTTMNVLGKNVHLILGDNTKLSLSGGILCYNTETNKPTLYIHSQSYEANMGQLYISSGYKGAAAGIGSDWEKTVAENCNRPAGDLEIHGGKLDVTGGEDAAGIGGGSSQEAGKITIYGGEITARGGDDQTTAGAGIGGTNNGCGHLIIYDGIVHAYGGKGAPGIGTGNCVLNDLTATHYQFTAGHSGSDGPDWDYTYAVSIVEIYGGQIDAHGGGDAAGIGGGEKSNGVILTIYGGDVKAYGNDDAAGIGGGWGGEGGLTIIYGGTVYAKGGGNGAGIGSGSEMIDQGGKQGGTTEIRGGHVEAYGGVDAAGIGGGEDADGGTVKIFGGYVYAQGKDYGAGIGGGQDGDGADVSIIGGTVIAKAGRDETGMRAIGPGEGCDNYGSLKLGNDLMVTSERTFTEPERKNACWYRTQVRIEPCDHSAVTYTVDGYGPNDHHIAHCVYCNHTETDRHTFDNNGVCTVCGVHTTAYAVKLYMPQAQPTGSFDGQTYGLTNTHLVVPDSAYRLPMATRNVRGYQFIGWEATTEPTGESYQSPYTNYQLADTLYRAGNKYTVTGNICFVARYKVSDIYLYDDEPNGEILKDYDGMKVNKVILSGRVFNKNNTWQSITLPFSLSAEELAASPLSGCTLKELDRDSSYNDTENKLVYLYFKDTTAIEAGKPYIIRWTEGNPVLSPEFENVTLTNKTSDDRARLLLFKSLYSPQTFTSANKTVLYFNENGVLMFPDGQEPVTVGAFRAYFRLTNLMGADPDADFTITSNIDGLEGIESVTGYGLPVTGKIIRNGMLFIERNGRIYNAQGALIED